MKNEIQLHKSNKSNCKLVNPVSLKAVEKHEVKFFTNSTFKEQELVIAAKPYSAGLFDWIYSKGEKENMIMVKFLKEETIKIISSSKLITGANPSLNPAQIGLVVDDFVTSSLPSFKWLTKQQYSLILRQGIRKELSDYTNFALNNLIDWINSYRIKHMEALGKQKMYEVTNNEPIHTNLSIVEKRRIKMRKFEEQLLAFKILLQNPTLINGVENNEDSKTQLRKAFERTLRIHQYQYGGGLDIVFDYLVRIGKITASIEEITKDVQFYGKDILSREGLKVSEAIENRFIVVSAKTDFIITFAKTIIESKETEPFIKEYIDGAFDKLKN